MSALPVSDPLSRHCFMPDCGERNRAENPVVDFGRSEKTGETINICRRCALRLAERKGWEGVRTDAPLAECHCEVCREGSSHRPLLVVAQTASRKFVAHAHCLERTVGGGGTGKFGAQAWMIAVAAIASIALIAALVIRQAQ